MSDDLFKEARKERDDFEELMNACDLAKMSVKNNEMVHGLQSFGIDSEGDNQKEIMKVVAPTVEAYVGSSSAPTHTKSHGGALDGSDQQEVRESGTSVQKDDNGFVFYKCRFCGITFNFMNTLRAHERIHDVSQPYVCGKCGESFEFACQLEYHSAQHSEVDGFKCDCGRTFFSYTEMLYHKHTDDPIDLIGAPETTTVMVNKKKIIPVSVQDLPQPAYATEGYEPKHPLRVYSDVRSKPYICEYCSKSYSDSRGLAYHMYSHRGERQFNPRASRYMMGREGVGYTDSRSYYLFPRTSGYVNPRF
ncbi:unnamed protein product [Caenorhabditis sp. 36 PRJEB53466]|nr:unnamed protein product [Caenorhabditis sp. 36 PRJEB53466]